MDVVRKLMNHGGGRGTGEAQAPPPDHSLGLMHLRKLFAELKQPPPGTSQTELESTLYNMLPLFCKVFGASPANDMIEKFPDILQFCSYVSRVMVTEIRRRASNISTDAASCAIVKFLEIESTEELSNGWMLLSTVNLLSMGTPSLIDCMTVASMPSTLVKCLYLFFDLPEVKDADSLEPGSEFTPRERRVLLQKVFVQILVRLCSHASPAEELARKDDLTLLFSAITSWCPNHNIPWRKSAAEVLVTISRHGLTPNVVQYIHSKGCISVCIDNMQRVHELSPIELVEMFVTVFCFLKDSSDVSQTLLDDFRTCNGYLFLSEFLLKMEKNEMEESIQALRNLVLLVGSLCTCGFIELKPSTKTSTLFQMPGFTIPQPSSKGLSIRNLQAFQVLQTVFLKASSNQLCTTILDVFSSLYHQDGCNYFILDPQNTLSQFAEKIHLKHNDIQVKFFEIIEFIVFNLNFVPCKELISLSILIKTNNDLRCSIMCMRTLLRILQYHSIYKDVFREVGLLEVMVTCLHRYAALLKEPSNGQEIELIPDQEQTLGSLVMEAVTILLNNNNNNANVFRESGGARCAHNMVPQSLCRAQALCIVQQLMLSSGGDDDMGTLLGLMHTTPPSAIILKQHILTSLLQVLKDSHRSRTVFRKVGGFVYVMSVLVSMEGALADPPKSPWDKVERKSIIDLVKLMFSAVTIAMRFEPANARVFATEVRFTSLTEAVRLLGCFNEKTFIEGRTEGATQIKPRDESPFSNLFKNISEHTVVKDLPQTLLSATLLLRYLYDMALDNFDRMGQSSTTSTLLTNSPNLKRFSAAVDVGVGPSAGGVLSRRGSTGSLTLNLTPGAPEPLIVHAGAVISLLHLVPAIYCEENVQLAVDLQYEVCELIKSVVRTERNQQVMCEAGLTHELLTHATLTLADEQHFLHPPLQYVFERLAAQSLAPRDLRDFLRLGSPLCCESIVVSSEPSQSGPQNTSSSAPMSGFDARRDDDEMGSESSASVLTMGAGVSNLSAGVPNSSTDAPRTGADVPSSGSNVLTAFSGEPVPLTRVKCLVSMTTPRDIRLHGASITPSFIEFDMSSEGFGCLYLPSIAPQSPAAPSVVSAGMIGGTDMGVVSGMGSGERVFPPNSGLTYSTWVCVDKFCAPTQDPHPIRLLNVVRGLQGREESHVCLSVFLSARDRSLYVSSQEHCLPTTASDQDQDPVNSDNVVHFWCPELTQEGQWHHLTIVLHKAGILKNSSVSIYINGSLVDTQKLHYISPYVNSGQASLASNSLISVFAYIGTPPAQRRTSQLLWRQGPCHLIEDSVSQSVVQYIYRLGPNYVGCLQAPAGDSTSESISTSVVSEERIMFGIHAHAISLMTVAKVRKIYNKLDARNVAKQLGMSAHENATPIRILHNSAGHLSGPARTFGAILMGYLGVRTFCPKPIARVVMNVGGTSALLGLVAMATDVEGLYAAVKALVCIVRSNGNAAREMDRVKGYQILGMIFKKKRHLLNSHILHLTFSLVGTLDSGRETSTIPHKGAFESLLCDLEIWHEAPLDLQRSVYEHFFELLTESAEHKRNQKLMQELGVVSKLLGVLSSPDISRSTLYAIASIITVLLKGATHTPSMLRVGQFMASLVPGPSVNERLLSDSPSPLTVGKHTPINGGDLFDMTGGEMFQVKLRNVFLDMFIKLSSLPPTETGAPLFGDEVQRVLGFDWLLLFLQRHLHESTVVLSASLLVGLLQNPHTLQRFREGGPGTGGGWLSETEPILQNRVGVLLGFNVGSNNLKQPLKREISNDVCVMPGFITLQWLLSHHTRVPQLYFLLMAMLLGQPVKDLPLSPQLDLDTVWLYVFGVADGKSTPLSRLTGKLDLCLEAAIVLLGMVRATLNMAVTDRPEDVWIKEYPITVMQFLLFLYHSQQDFVPLSMSGEFLSALASTVFPYKLPSEANSEVASPLDDFRPFPASDPLVMVEFRERTEGSLSTHPAKRFVMDFLRRIVMDSLSIPQSGRTSAPVIDIVLEVSPEHSTRHERRLFQTEMLSIVMDQLLAADVLLGEQGALAVSTGSSYTQMANNVFYIAGRVVDKLWQGTYTRDPNEVFDFISMLISQSKRKASGLSLDGIYKSLNRTLLYLLSRPISCALDQTNILDTLHKLITNRSLILGPGNYDQEFIGCLCYCLLQLCDNKPANISSPVNLRRTTWHVDTEPGSDSDDPTTALDRAACTGPTPALSEEGLQLLMPAARRVWEELFVCKKPVIEDIFKVVLNASDSKEKSFVTPDLLDIKSQIQDAASRVWSTYYENECKGLYNQQERIQSQLHTKLQKMGQGMMRFASRKVKKEAPVKVTYVTMQAHPYGLEESEQKRVKMNMIPDPWLAAEGNLEWYSATMTHGSIVRDLVDVQSKQVIQSQRHMLQYLEEDWAEMEGGLIRERGLWGPPVGTALDKWMLDVTEGPYRMRKKMRTNSDFYIHYPYRPDLENSEQKYRTAQSLDSKRHYESQRKLSLLYGDSAAESAGPATGTATGPATGGTAAALETQSSLDKEKTIDEAMKAFSDNNSTDMADGTPTLLQHLPKQKPQTSNNLDADDDVVEADVEPAALVMENDTDTQAAAALPEQQPDNQSILKLLEKGEMITHMFRCARIQGLDTVEGLLLFVKEHFYIVDGFTLLRTKEIADISCLLPHLHDPIIPRTTKGVINKRMCFKMAFDDVREVHKRRYLLQPIAVEIFSADGRNFLLAFPRKVRNKVYARFQSLAKELTDSAQESVSGQRQGAKVEPGTGIISSLIGEKSVTQRWERGEITNFEYLMCLNTLAGRSYNDLMQYPVFPWTVADYDSEELDLSDPATFRDLSAPMGAQTTDRLKQFKKRYQDWDDPTGETPPYHYGTHYSSAMIVASYLVRMEPFTQIFLRLQGGHFDLADRMFHSIKDAWTSASKHNMADVKELIPEFFYLPEFLNNSNRFDLGVKQSGVCLGDVVLPAWAKGDAREFIRAHREALECDYVSSRLHEWIDLIFGHKQQGPAAVDAVNVFHHLFYEGNVDIYAIDDPLKRTATIGFINNFGQIPKQLFKKPHPQKKLAIRSAPIVPMGSFVTSSTDRLLFYNLDNLRPSMQPVKELKNSVGQIIHNDRAMMAVEQNKTLIPPGFSKYLAWGFPDMSIRVGNYDSDKATSVYENWLYGDVLCAVCPNDKTLVTAGTTTVVNVWRFGKGRGEKNRLTLRRSLFGHTEAVTCLAVSSTYNVIVSGSRDRTCIMWDLNELVFVRQLRGHPAPVAAIHINDLTGEMATCAGTYLYLWTINGTEIASVNTATGRNQQILCVTMTQMKEWDINNVIITGNSDGVVRMWSLEHVEVPNEIPQNKSTDVAQSLKSNTSSDSLKLNAVSAPIPVRSQSGLSSKTMLANRLEELSAKAGSSVESDSIGYSGFRSWQDEDRKSNPGDLWDENEASPRRIKQEGSVFQMDGDDLNSSFDVGPCEEDLERGTAGSGMVGDFCVITDADIKEASGGSAGVRVEPDPSGSSTPGLIPSGPPSLGLEAGKPAEGQGDLSASSSSGGLSVSPLGSAGGRRGGLREGFHWQKQLVFRSKLTMHTAFERKDNKEPAAITALGIAKDHKTMYVGDAKGRVYSWTVVEHPGRGAADHWVKDDGGDSCVSCSVKFSVYERRHHCRNCGQLFCSKCSSYETEIRRLRIVKPVRVCHGCYQTLNKAKDVKTTS